MQRTNRRPLRVGIIGCGNQAADHAVAYAALPREEVRVVAVADTVLARAEHFAAAQTAEAVPFGSVAQMLDEAQLDAVSIVVPNRFHHPLTLQALRAGAHVLCEKPPAMTAREAEEMEEVARALDLVLTYGVLYRHMYRNLLPFVQELGPIFRATASWNRLRGIPGWGIYGDKAMQGGGAGIDLGVHVLDLAWWLMGRPKPRLASARAFDHKARTTQVWLMGERDPNAVFTVEDRLVAAIDFDDARIDLSAAFASDVEEEDPRVTLEGVHGTVSFRLMTGQPGPDPACAPRIVTERHGRIVHETIAEPLPMTSQEACNAQIARFVAAASGDEAPFVPAADGTAVQRMLGAMYASAAQAGKQVTIG